MEFAPQAVNVEDLSEGFELEITLVNEQPEEEILSAPAAMPTDIDDLDINGLQIHWGAAMDAKDFVEAARAQRRIAALSKQIEIEG